jgi:predicted O-methyltransferase YrrM
MRLNAHIAPDAPATSAFHRGVMAVQAARLRRRAHPLAPAIARALEDVARDRFDPEEREWLARIERRRTEIPFALAAGDLSDQATAEERSKALGNAWEVCRWVSIPPVWGRLLFRLVRELRPASLVELGTGLGLSAAYQAAAMELNGSGRIVTIDNHPAARIGDAGFARLALGERIDFRFGDIDELLPDLLEAAAPFELAFLDAEHSEAATVRHFDAVVKRIERGGVLVLDDTTQTDEMRRAWRSATGHDRTSLAVPLRRTGVVVA